MHATYSCFQSNVSGRKVRDARRRPARHSTRRRAFSLTELLVVIGIIVLLIGLLLVALRQVKVKTNRTRSEVVMQQFANACSEFQTDHGFYPGVIPDEVLAANNPCPISGTENAHLHLVGGYRVVSPSDSASGPVAADYTAFKLLTSPNNPVKEVLFASPAGQWKLAFYTQRLGEGPIINGKPHAPYFTPGPDDLMPVSGQYGEPEAGFLPDLVDAWENPIIFAKRARSSGPLLQDNPPPPATPLPQFTSVVSGNLVGADAFLDGLKSMFAFAGPNGLAPDDRRNAWAVVLGVPAFYKSAEPLYGTAKGAFVLISAGADGTLFTVTDGPGSQATPIGNGNLDSLIINVGPKVIDQFDDIRVFGGG